MFIHDIFANLDLLLLLVGLENPFLTTHTTAAEQFIEALACNKDGNRQKRKRVGTLRSQVCWLSGLPEKWPGWCMVA